MNATAMTRETGTVNSILLGNGIINGSVIGTFNVVKNSGPLDITDPAANINNSMVLNITREGCGETNLCVEEPDNCDPLTDNMCQFMSSNVTVSTTTNAFNMTVRLSGYSMGYFALGLAMNASEGTSTIFACGNDTGGVFLRTFTRDNVNENLTSINRSVTVPAINLSGRSIECEFTILDLNNVETRETDGVVAVVILGNGTLNASMLNPLNIIHTERVNLTSPTGTVISAQNGARAGRSSDAMLILMSLVTLLAALQG
ncbi:putative ferric-chelate reductase 1 isoform X3 [Phyllopteryx taeniolatus]|uniref:putative ferric-chelate reductase 1 isoform X3 n=1 Tax=Phyllopteryx taeniolatus TaxID=161469 RepID=UPI002AD3304C|nr:putative ferric-chelate reductase 1 isoform X3 [Phyllopteryx taeniolatus]